jgi:hypothetical protein
LALEQQQEQDKASSLFSPDDKKKHIRVTAKKEKLKLSK